MCSTISGENGWNEDAYYIRSELFDISEFVQSRIITSNCASSQKIVFQFSEGLHVLEFTYHSLCTA